MVLHGGGGGYEKSCYGLQLKGLNSDILLELCKILKERKIEEK